MHFVHIYARVRIIRITIYFLYEKKNSITKKKKNNLILSSNLFSRMGNRTEATDIYIIVSSITDSNRRGGDRRTTVCRMGSLMVAPVACCAVAGRRQVRDAPASTRLIFSAPVPPGPWVSGPAVAGWTVAAVAATGCSPLDIPCPDALVIPTENSV